MEEDLDSLQGVLSCFYKKLRYIEKIFLYSFIADMVGYTILFLAFLISTGEIKYNFVTIILVFFPMISGITMVKYLLFINNLLIIKYFDFVNIPYFIVLL